MNQSIAGIVKECVELYKRSEPPEKMEEYVHNELIRNFNQYLDNAKPKMQRTISHIFKHFSATIELKAPHMRAFKEVFNEIFNNDYYGSAITTYEHTSPYHLFTYLKGMLNVLTGKLTVGIRFDQENSTMSMQRFVWRQTYIEQETFTLLTHRLHYIIQFIFKNLNTKVNETLNMFLAEYLEEFDKKIEENANTYRLSSSDDELICSIR